MASVQQVELSRVPDGRPVPSDFIVRDVGAVASPALGEVAVRVSMFGLNAGLRSRLGTGRSTTLGPALEPGDTPQSDAVGVVVESHCAGIESGDTVVGLLPWSSESRVAGGALRVLEPGSDPAEHLTILGHVGLTAYVGLFTVGRLTAGETVWISAAAGGVGSCACQLAQRRGARVIASAGGPARTRFLSDVLGIEHVVDRSLPLMPQITRHAPEGLDVYLDLVGGDHFRVALPLMRERGRIVVAGSAGDPSEQPALRDPAELLRKRISLIGMSVTDHPEARSGLEELVTTHACDHPLVAAATIRHGMEGLPAAFCDLFTGSTLGRGLVAVGP